MPSASPEPVRADLRPRVAIRVGVVGHRAERLEGVDRGLLRGTLARLLRQVRESAVATTADVRVHGLVAFLFACYSAGTPQFDQYVTRADRKPLQIAEQPFLAALPKALLSHPQGGALACIGHVERAWNYSFSTNKLGDQLIPYQNAVRRILGGLPVGYALTDMRQRYASLAASVGKTLEDFKKFGTPINDQQLVAVWAARNDAGGYVVIGDPAVCIRVEGLV